MKKALCVGINDYPGVLNDLEYCTNDAADWTSKLYSYGFSVKTLLDKEVTVSRLKSELEALILPAQAGDELVWTHSGHGTQVPDWSGDEADFWDEALYLADGGVLVDDDIRAILDQAREGVHITVVLDTCFSGTATRALAARGCKARFVPYSQWSGRALQGQRRRAFLGEQDMVEVLLAACADDETSAEDIINGKGNGVFTAYALQVLEPWMTYQEFYSAIRQKLPSKLYPQTPQLEGRVENKALQVFGSTTEPPVEPPPEEPPVEPPPDEPPEEPTGCFSWTLGRFMEWLRRKSGSGLRQKCRGS